MVNKKIVIICSIIALILVIGIVLIQIKMWKAEYDKLGKEEQNINTNVTNNISTENKVENASSTNTQTGENVTNVKGEEEVQEETDEGENQAKELVKKEWGEKDTTVYYTVDDKSGDIYTVSVRSKTTTVQLAEYEVNMVTGDIQIK